ncbi:putative cys met metabolism pyridoxal phosphate-dependent enzyme protein [Neofusicoccum parvum UCRNP2]|uniref:Putative cys met metabolism pyridoxal phosphate-dependent enzyme protein n=1 Tax=Botryosphaeria parva (strain UCR-NP2) TaxID=1287680 RepID=R1ENI2_BOTPV|nr:putative cys met metabolism pyridoxal phosphate-dependent enzyme protein [Neofusicoccum parvum UCRNP2]
MARYTRENSPWKKRVLVPFWVLRDLLTLVIIASYALTLAALVNNEDDLDDDFDQSDINAAKAIVAAFMAAFVISLLLDIFCMIKYARHSLSPGIFLIISVIQTTFWTVLLILQIIGSASLGRAYITIFGVGCFLLYLGLLIYASTVYHRARKSRSRGAYTAAANPAATNPLSAQEYGQTGYTGYGQAPAYNSSGNTYYQESYAPHAQELKPVPAPAQGHATEYFSPAQVRSPLSPVSHEYVMPPPHPSVSPSQSPLPASHPSTGQLPYVLPPPVKGDAHEMPGR